MVLLKEWLSTQPELCHQHVVPFDPVWLKENPKSFQTFAPSLAGTGLSVSPGCSLSLSGNAESVYLFLSTASVKTWTKKERLILS